MVARRTMPMSLPSSSMTGTFLNFFFASTSAISPMVWSAVAHLSAIKGRIPFINFFDGFRTSHEVQKIAVWDYEDLADMCDMEAVSEFREHALNPERPAMRGSHENGDIFFQHREACNGVYDALPAIVEDYMHQVNAKLGTNYELFNLSLIHI